MTTSGHGTKRMLSRGPALLLAPLLLLCRGNPQRRRRDPGPVVFCFVVVLFKLPVLRFPLFLFMAVSPFPVLPPTWPRRAAGSVVPRPPHDPPLVRALRAALRARGWDARRSPALGRTKLSPSISTAAAPSPRRVHSRLPVFPHRPLPTRVAGSSAPAWGAAPRLRPLPADRCQSGGKKEKFGLPGVLGAGEGSRGLRLPTGLPTPCSPHCSWMSSGGWVGNE